MRKQDLRYKKFSFEKTLVLTLFGKKGQLLGRLREKAGQSKRSLVILLLDLFVVHRLNTYYAWNPLKSFQWVAVVGWWLGGGGDRKIEGVGQKIKFDLNKFDLNSI